MAWWTTVPGLTPVAIHDADHISGSQMLDQIGTNHLTATGVLVPYSFQAKSVCGNGNALTYANAIGMPSTGVFAALITPMRQWVTFSGPVPGGNYLLHQAANGSWYTARDNTNSAYGTTTPVFGKSTFVAMVKSTTTVQLFSNGTPIGPAIANAYVPLQISNIGYSPGEFNFDSDELMAAFGVWTGIATQADLQALEVAVRAALVGSPPSCRGFQPPEGRLSSSPFEALDVIGLRNRNREQVLGSRNIYFAGNGRITGNVREKGTATNAPVHRRVVLIDERTRLLMQEQWSDAATGSYNFINVDHTHTFTVLSYDHTGAFRAVVADGQIPELIP